MSYLLLLHKRYIAHLISPSLFVICNKITECVCDALALIQIPTLLLLAIQLDRDLKETMVERTKRYKWWLSFTRINVDDACYQNCDKSFACKGGKIF